jgi:hypothetical protein
MTRRCENALPHPRGVPGSKGLVGGSKGVVDLAFYSYRAGAPQSVAHPAGDNVRWRTFATADRLPAPRDRIPRWRPVARAAGRDVALGGVTVRAPNNINAVGADDCRPGVE